MKATKITYWGASAVLALMMTFSTYAYLTQPSVKEGFHHLGFPDYFRIELAIAKLLGAIALIAPVAGRIKEWSYAGFAFNFISAIISHLASGDPVGSIVLPLVCLGLLVVSYAARYKMTLNSVAVQ